MNHVSSIIYHTSSAKKGFSFLEVLIVIMIVGILFVAFRSSFQIKNKDILYGQACIQTIYGEVNNFLYTAISSKSLSLFGTAIFPDTYIITFDPLGQSIKLGYKEGGNPYYAYSNIPISGNTSNYCISNNYTILMSGDTYEASIAKGSKSARDRAIFSLSGAGISTGANIFLQCDMQGTGCKTIARFETDIRTFSIKKQMCLTRTGTDCLERDR